MRVPATDASTVVAPLGRAAILYELGNFLSGIEEMKGEAARHFRAALEANPRHARALAGLGRFDDALAADPNDPEIHLAYAESLLKDQVGPLAETSPEADAAAFRTAREHAQRAVDLGEATGRALGDLGTSYITENDRELGPGIAALERAHALLPARTDFALHLFAMYRRIADRSKADPLFARLEAARNAQVAYAARAIIMRVETGRANALVAGQKLDEAAAVLRRLAAEAGDGDATADLKKQAGDLERTAATNRQIETYNDATRQVNRSEYAAARKSLQQLLAGPVDPDIARDAKKLLEQLKGR